MKPRSLFLVASAALLVAGCDRRPTVVIEPSPPPPPPIVPAIPSTPVARTETFETHALRREIDLFELGPSTVQSARVKKAFAEIDGEIAELIEHVAKKTGDQQAKAARKLADLRAYRDAEQVRFLRLEALAPLKGREDADRPPVRREGTAERIGEKIDDTARKVENKLRDAAETIRDKTR